MERIIIWTLFLGIVGFAIGGRAYDAIGSVIGLFIGLILGILVGIYTKQKIENKN